MISRTEHDCAQGRSEILTALHALPNARRIAIEPLRRELVARLARELVLESSSALLPPPAIEAKFASMLGDDPVFAHMEPHTLDEVFDPAKVEHAHHAAEAAHGRVVTIGTGATLLLPHCDLLLYVDVARWEIQQRQRRGEVPNLGPKNADADPGHLYKRAYFLDWRAADRHKDDLYQQVDFWIDGNLPEQPVMLGGEQFHNALATVSRQPFRVVPFFDPGPWGGQWMRRHCNLPDDPANYAWCFDCVPEENSLILRSGAREFELPALTLLHQQPQNLLGAGIVEQLGAESPIRFDFLDTIAGGNLSLQVHPLPSYIHDQFGMTDTQDESYYMLDAGPDATVYLGQREGIDPKSMAADLCSAQAGGPAFPAEKYVNTWPALKHDHFLIPGGTVHCSGGDSMVLEISATPYIFNFKLWDWGRLGLDGRPRPIHLEHGLKNIQWNRTTAWVRESLIDREEPVASGEGWREERTGLHPLEFIVPAAVGPYTIRPAKPAQQQLATIKAYVRGGK